MDEYDDYGNYLGEVIPSDHEEEEEDNNDDDDDLEETEEDNISRQIVLHEDRALYPAAASVFGDDVEIVLDDGQSVNRNEPIIPREELIKEKKKKVILETDLDKFENLLSSTPTLTRNVAFLGHLHSGKSTLVSLVHKKRNDSESKMKKTVNVRSDEKAMKISIKARANSSACLDSTNKSYLITSLDCPGHTNFIDEVETVLEVCDGAVLVVDVIEGIQIGTELCIDSLKRHGLLNQTIICLTKMDRLIHELKLPIRDAGRKIQNILDKIELLFDDEQLDYNRIIFSSPEHGWCVSYKSMARLASVNNTNNNNEEDINKLARLISDQDYYYDSVTRKFSTKNKGGGNKTGFELFLLEPIYKIYSHVLGGEASSLCESFLGLKLTLKEQELNALPLLKRVLSKILPNSSCLIDSIVAFVKDPVSNLKQKLNYSWSGNLNSDIGKDVLSNKNLLINCVKFIAPGDDSNDLLDLEEENSFSFGSEVNFRVLARIYSGKVKVGDTINLFEPRSHSKTENDLNEDDDLNKVTIKSIRFPSRGGGYPCRKVSQAENGNIVLLSGIDLQITKSATLSNLDKMNAFLPLKIFSLLKTKPVAKLAVEPLIPAELPKMLTGLRAIQRSYPGCHVNVEESGEYVIFGLGELYLDSIMRDLRERYSKGTEVKVCDPFIALRETVTGTSSIRSIGETSNLKNKFTLISTPLEEKLLFDIENEIFSEKLHTTKLEKVLKNDYGFDILASRTLWAFGPEDSTNAFVDDTLEEEKEKCLFPAKDAIIQGFQYACREGPLCGEPVRGVKFKLLDASIAKDERDRGGGQVIKTIRRISHTSMLKSNPALFEPVFCFEATISNPRAINLVKNCLTSRRGSWDNGSFLQSIPATPLQRFKGFVPVLDAYGLETELRLKSRGSVYCQMYFDHWQLAPGDPLNDSILLRPLEPSPNEFLARDLVVKTRRRKGLSESIEGHNVIDEQILKQLASSVKESE